MDEGHGALRMKEIEAHLDETYFAWLGTTGPESVFYYRIQSPSSSSSSTIRGRLLSTDHASRRAATCTPWSARPTATTTERTYCASTTSNIVPMPLTGTFTEVVARRTEAFARAS